MGKDKKYYVAITGASGSGKTSVLQMLKEMNFLTKDYDTFSVEVIKKSERVHLKLQEIIGEDFVPNGQVELKRIGEYFDNHCEAEKRFETWYQPYLGKQIRKDILKSNYQGVWFFDVPFLGEKEIADLFDEIWLIKTDFEVCCQRIQNRNGYSAKKAKYLVERLKVLSRCEETNVYCVSNNSSKIDLEKQVKNRLYRMMGKF